MMSVQLNSKREMIHRYDELLSVRTSMNKLEAIISWICGLRSIGYTTDLLYTKHNINEKKEIDKCAHSISNLSECAMGLLDQAYSGPPEISFLPLYYCVLNLAKIMIIFSGKKDYLDIRQNRHHGLTYPPQTRIRRNIFTEEVGLKEAGTLQLLYEAITNSNWFAQSKKFRMANIFPYIYGISIEYSFASGKPALLQPIRLFFEGNDSNGYYLNLELRSDYIVPNGNNLRYLLAVKGFKAVKGKPNNFISRAKIKGVSKEEAKLKLLCHVRRYLLIPGQITPGTNKLDQLFTPISAKRFLLPFEIPIYITFFHLSNLVRYNPEFLYMMKDSSAWALLLNLRKDTIFEFLLGFWSFVNQTTFIFSS